MRRTLWLASVACALYAADSAVEGPVLGYVNSAAGVRGVLGIVGSARLSAPLTGELQGAAILPGTTAVVAKNPSGALVRVNLNDGSLHSLGLENVSTYVVSPAGGAVLAIAEGRLRAVTASGESKGNHALPGALRSMAVSDEASTVAVVAAESEGEAVHLLNDQGSRRVFHSAGISALGFLPGSRDVIFATSEGAIHRLGSDLQHAEMGRLPGTTALAGTADGRVIAVSGKTIAALASDGSPAVTIECSCEATSLRPLGQSRFLLSSGEDGPLWVLDASTAQPRVAFIPEAVNE